VVVAVVETVSVAVVGRLPEMFTGLVEPKLNTGRFCALLGLAAMAAVSAMSPSKPPLGVIVIVEVFPALAPAVTVTEVPAKVKPGGMAVTVTEPVLDALE
jgi:hypothetical protein